jgi:hypothetical protein
MGWRHHSIKHEVINMLSFHQTSKINFRVSENEPLNPLWELLFWLSLCSRQVLALCGAYYPPMEGSFFKAPWYSRFGVNACSCSIQVMAHTLKCAWRAAVIMWVLCFHISALGWIREPTLTLAGAAIQTWYIKRTLDK